MVNRIEVSEAGHRFCFEYEKYSDVEYINATDEEKKHFLDTIKQIVDELYKLEQTIKTK